MLRNEVNAIYDEKHNVSVYYRNGTQEDRQLNITIEDKINSLCIKLRDAQDYKFNYTEIINHADFEIIRNDQSLDINFGELKIDLIEMLHQNLKKEMSIKCEILEDKCKLVFCGKSKIKTIIFLTLDLHLTDQTEIFNEMNNNLQELKNANYRIQRQLETARRAIADKESQIEHITILRKQAEAYFIKNLKQVDIAFHNRIRECEDLIFNKLMLMKQKLVKLSEAIMIIQNEAGLKSDSSARLLKTMESLRIEAIDSASVINDLKKDNSNLHAVNHTLETTVADLKRNLAEKENLYMQLKQRNDELMKDLEQISVVLTQKNKTNEELGKDLIQANQMLVNFNNHYDMKVKLVEELQGAIGTKDTIIKEQRIRTTELLKEFQDYKNRFSCDEFRKLRHELVLAQNKIQELEKSIIKANKINGLLTQKVSAQNAK